MRLPITAFVTALLLFCTFAHRIVLVVTRRQVRSSAISDWSSPPAWALLFRCVPIVLNLSASGLGAAEAQVSRQREREICDLSRTPVRFPIS
jgi:hypothetical protein